MGDSVREAYQLFVQGRTDEALALCIRLGETLPEYDPNLEYVLALQSRLERPATRARNQLRRLEVEKNRLNGSLLSHKPLARGSLEELMEQVFVAALGGGPRMPVRTVEEWIEKNLELLRGKRR